VHNEALAQASAYCSRTASSHSPSDAGTLPVSDARLRPPAACNTTGGDSALRRKLHCGSFPCRSLGFGAVAPGDPTDWHASPLDARFAALAEPSHTQDRLKVDATLCQRRNHRMQCNFRSTDPMAARWHTGGRKVPDSPSLPLHCILSRHDTATDPPRRAGCL
jgi:hypothetical protein